MINKYKNNGNSGIGFIGVLAVLFIALKLTGVITWSWWLVLSPLWGSCVAVVVFFVLLIIGIAIKTGGLRGK